MDESTREPPGTEGEHAQPDDETVDLRVGCADLPPGLRRSRFFERLSYLEVQGTAFQLPKRSVLERWRDEARASAEAAAQAAAQAAADAGADVTPPITPRGFGLVAPQVISHKPGRKGYRRSKTQLTPEQLAQAGWFRDTEVVTRAVDALARSAIAADAEVVLFRSPGDFSPSAANREALERFFGELAPAERFGPAVRVWEPQGLWEPQVAARLAGEMGVLYACDPLSNDPIGPGSPDGLPPDFYAQLPQSSAYFRLTGLGRARQRFDEYAMDELLAFAMAYDRAWIVFANLDRYPDAIQFTRSLESL